MPERGPRHLSIVIVLVVAVRLTIIRPTFLLRSVSRTGSSYRPPETKSRRQLRREARRKKACRPRATLAYRGSASALAAFFVVFAFRSFCWLIYFEAMCKVTLNNLGYMLHLTYILTSRVASLIAETIEPYTVRSLRGRLLHAILTCLGFTVIRGLSGRAPRVGGNLLRPLSLGLYFGIAVSFQRRLAVFQSSLPQMMINRAPTPLLGKVSLSMSLPSGVSYSFPPRSAPHHGAPDSSRLREPPRKTD